MLMNSRLSKIILAGILFTLIQPPTPLSAAAADPVITRPPAGATYSAGAKARFYVNASSTDGGYLTYQWYRSQEFSAPQTNETDKKAGAIALGDSATLITTTPIPTVPGTKYFYYWVEITNNKADGDTKTIESTIVQAKIVDRTLHTELMEGNFEITSNGASTPLGPYWNTTHDGHTSDDLAGHTGNTNLPRKVLEVYPASTYNTTGNNTSKVAELSAHVASSIYQEIATVPGRIYEWSLDHGARNNGGSNPQVLAVVIGTAINMRPDYSDFGITDRWRDEAGVSPANYPYGTNYTTYFYDIVNKLAQDLNKTVVDMRTTSPGGAPYTTTYGNNTYYVYISSDTRDAYFVPRSGVYSVPEGQGTTVFGFVPITPDGSTGNLLDNIFFASGSPLVPSPTINYSNAVTLSAPTKAGYTYGLAEVRGSSVSLVNTADAYYDPDGAGASPEVSVSITSGLGDGWYSTYSSNTPFVDNGIITFKNLTPGKTYRIVGIPILAVNPALGVNETPEYVLDEGYYKDIQIPPAYEGNNTSTIWNIDVDTYMDGATPRARATVKNARADVQYALLADDGSGNKPVTTTGTAWTPGNAGLATFNNLDPDAYYYLVARPYGYSETTYADAAYDADGITPKYIKIKTPGAAEEIAGDDVSRSADCKSIELENSLTGYTYAVVDPETGAIIGITQPGGGTLTFPGLDASKTYQIVTTKTGETNWLRGVRVYPCIDDNDDFFIDYPGELVKSSHDAGGNIPSGIEYHIRSNDGSTWILGDADTWTAGSGGGAVNLSIKTLNGNTISILDSITSLGADATIYYRAKADPAYTGRSASTVKELVIPKRPAAPDDNVHYTFDYVNEEIDAASPPDGLLFAQINASWTGVSVGSSWTFSDAGWDEVSGRPFNVRIPAVADVSFASVVRTDTIPARPPAPGVGIDSNSADSIVITNMTPGVSYQYYTDLDAAWITYTPPSGKTESDSIPFAPNKNCYVRLSATATAPASFITVLTSPISIQPVYFATYRYGVPPVSQAVVILNGISLPVDVENVILDGVNSEYYHFASEPASPAEKQVPGGGINTNWVLIPNSDLDAETYNTRLKMTYTYNGTHEVYADVYLTVEKADWDMSQILGVFDVSKTKAQKLVLDIALAPAGATLSYYYYYNDELIPFPGNPESPVDSNGETDYTFTSTNGLQPGTRYPVWVIANGDSNHNASQPTPLSDGYTAYATPVFNDIINIGYTAENLTFKSGYSSGDYILRCASCAGSPEILDPESPSSISGILDGNSTDIVFSITRKAGVSPNPHPASEPGDSTIQGRPAAPVAAVTPATSGNGTIAVTGQFEYRVHGSAAWSTASNTVSVPAGDYDVRYRASLTVFASHVAIVTVSSGIVTQPVSVTVVEGCIHDTLSVAIQPTANTVVYQWYSNTSGSYTPVSGADSCCYALLCDDLAAGTYRYYCKITVSGITFSSDTVTVTVLPELPGSIKSVYPSAVCPGGNINLHFSGAPPYGVSYTVDDGIEYSFMVTGPDDTTIVAETAGVYTFRNMLDGYACGCGESFTVQVSTAFPDFVASAGTVAASASGGNSVTVTVDVKNEGAVGTGSPVSVTLYADSIAVSNIIGTGSISESISPGSTKQVSISVADITLRPAVNIVARVNDSETAFPSLPECDTLNNVITRPNPFLSLSMKKDATLLLDPPFAHNGMYANPISVLRGEHIEYRITAINPSAGKDVIIRDTLPPYMDYEGNAVPSLSAPPGMTTGNPPQYILSWTLTGIPEDAESTVKFEATPAPGVNASQPLFINRAWVSVYNTVTGGMTSVPTANSTYHQGAGVSVVTFSASAGGSIYNAGRQAVDYGTRAGGNVLVVPDEGYRFAGWSHDAYTSYRGKPVAARSGIMHYDTLAIYGDVSLRADFLPNRYHIRYCLNDAENAETNPASYTVESGAITLVPPSKPGDVFTGWTGSNGEEPQETVTIPAHSTGDREYYANFLYSSRETYTEEDAADKIWSSGDGVYIRTSLPGGIVRIYTPDGILRRQHTILAAGTTKLRLDPGIHIVTLNSGTGVKIIIRSLN
jgi:uncharacterized repeat protein (TIGR02543 family)